MRDYIFCSAGIIIAKGFPKVNSGYATVSWEPVRVMEEIELNIVDFNKIIKESFEKSNKRPNNHCLDEVFLNDGKMIDI